MAARILIITLFILSASCKKEEATERSASWLLTRKTWTLASYGYDLNNNGLVDNGEENIRDCERDNRYSFFAGGNGLFEENNLSCSGIAQTPFTWKFINGESEIDFTVGIAKILRLDDNELAIFQESISGNGQTVKLITVFRH